MGYGIGLNYEIFQNVLTDIIPIAKNVNLEIWELNGYKINPNNMGSKETFSLMATTCGFLGIYIYFRYFFKLLQKKYVHKFLSKALVIFCFIESIVTGNVIADSAIFILIFAKMAVNTDERRKIYEKYPVYR